MELLQQDYPSDRFEIIVADGNSSDQTAQIIKQLSEVYPNITLLPNPLQLSSAGRNVGFKNGKGDIFVIMDGHCWIGHRKLFANIANCFKRTGAQCLGRPQPLDPPDMTDFQQAVALARASKVGHGGDSLIYSAYEGFVSPISHGAVYKREVIERVGYVDESFDACEDVEFNYRVEKAGFKTYMSPSVAVKYYPRESLAGLFRQVTRYGKGRFQLLKKHPQSFSLSGFAPVIFVIGLFSLPVLGLIDRAFWKIYGVACATYLLIVFLASTKISMREGMRFLRYLPLIYFVIHFGLGWGFLLKLLKR